MALNTLDMCLGSKHGSVHIIKVKLARMAKGAGDLERAKALLREVIEGFGNYHLNLNTTNQHGKYNSGLCYTVSVHNNPSGIWFDADILLH